MTKSAKSSIVFAAAATAVFSLTVLTAATPAEAKTICKQSICLQTTHSTHQFHATPGFQGTNWDHFNVTVSGVGAINGGKQFESRGPFTFPRLEGKTLIAIQACSSGGFLKHAACDPFVQFSYRVNEFICPVGEPCGSISQP